MTVYSHSRLSTYESCPFKFKLKYLDKAKPEFTNTIEAFMGSMVHDTLENLYKTLKFEKVMTKEDVLEYYNQVWKDNFVEDLKIVKKEFTSENYRQMGERMLKEYYDLHHPFNEDRLISCEEKVLITFGLDDKYQLQGFIDRLSCTEDGTYYIQDYKTANSLPYQEYADKDRQLALYSIAVKERYKDCKKMILRWHYLAFNKKVESVRTDEELEELKKRIAELIDEIETTRDFPTKESALCDYCEFRYMCPKFIHLYKLEKMLDYKEEDGVKLVDKYSVLKQKKEEIEDQLNEVQNAIISLADRDGIDIVYGSKEKARIWQKDCVRLPGKKEPIYPEMVKLLKGIGVFADFSQLDNWELGKRIEAGTLPKHVIEMLQGFIKKEKIQRIYMSRNDKLK